MATVLFISESKLKAFTTLHQNLDMALLTSCIYIAQEIHLQPVIGSRGYYYYENLVKSVQLSGGTMSTPDRIMLDDYIAPIVTWAAYYEALPEIWARKMNKGIQVGSSEQSNAVDIKTMQYFRDNALGKYQFYIQRLIDRVQAFSGDYPWFYAYNNKDGMPSTNEVYFGGIHFPNGLRRPPIKQSWSGNLPMYQGPEYGACIDC
jgi:hypothetical protein